MKLTLITKPSTPPPPSTRRGPYSILIVIIGTCLLLLLAACESRPVPPAPPLTPTAGAVAPEASATAPPPAQAVGTPRPDYTPVSVGGVPYIPPEPWLAAPTLAPNQPTPTPYGGSAAPGTARKPGQAATPTVAP
jgi:hypothetical protein